jgi:hypothetical protein
MSAIQKICTWIALWFMHSKNSLIIYTLWPNKYPAGSDVKSCRVSLSSSIPKIIATDVLRNSDLKCSKIGGRPVSCKKFQYVSLVGLTNSKRSHGNMLGTNMSSSTILQTKMIQNILAKWWTCISAHKCNLEIKMPECVAMAVEVSPTVNYLKKLHLSY